MPDLASRVTQRWTVHLEAKFWHRYFFFPLPSTTRVAANFLSEIKTDSYNFPSNIITLTQTLNQLMPKILPLFSFPLMLSELARTKALGKITLHLNQQTLQSHYYNLNLPERTTATFLSPIYLYPAITARSALITMSERPPNKLVPSFIHFTLI